MKGMRKWKRFLAMLLVALMVSTLVPVNVFAEELNGELSSVEVQSEEPTEEEQSEVEPVVEVQLEDGLTAEVPSEEPETAEVQLEEGSTTEMVLSDEISMLSASRSMAVMQAPSDSKEKGDDKVDKIICIRQYYDYDVLCNNDAFLKEGVIDESLQMIPAEDENCPKEYSGDKWLEPSMKYFPNYIYNKGNNITTSDMVEDGHVVGTIKHIQFFLHKKPADYKPLGGKITIKAKGDTQVYSGKEITAGDIELQTFTDEKTGERYQVKGIKVNKATGTDAGKYKIKLDKNDGEFKIVKINNFPEVNVTDQFEVELVDAYLVIEPREVTLTSYPCTKDFDGEPFTKNELEKGGVKIGGKDGFVEGQGLESVVFADSADKDLPKEVGIYEGKNAFTYTLNANTKPGNYKITRVFGDLTINPTVTYEYDFQEGTYWFNGQNMADDWFYGRDYDFGANTEYGKEYYYRRLGVPAGDTVQVISGMDNLRGFKFSGWEIKDNNDVVIGKDGSFTMPNRNVVITAHYDLKECRVTYIFDCDDEIKDKIIVPTLFKETYTSHYGSRDSAWEKDVFKLPDEYKDKYEFIGWTSFDEEIPTVGEFRIPDPDTLKKQGEEGKPVEGIVFIGKWKKLEDNNTNGEENTVNPGPTDGDPDGPTGDGPTGGPTGGGTDDTVTVEPTPVFPAPLNGPVNPVVVNTLDNPFPALVADADNDQLPMLVVEEPENEPAPTEPTVIQVADEETPLANVLLDHDHLDCILHLLLMLGAMVIFGVYTHNHKKLQSEIQELEEAIEGRKSGKITSARKHVA